MRITRVLIVDDQEIIRSFLVRVLKNKYEVISARDTRDAIRMLRQHQVDVVVSDIYMPGDNGFKLCEHLRSEYPGVPIVFLSALIDPPTVEQATALGTCVLAKPPSIRDLVETVDRLARTA